MVSGPLLGLQPDSMYRQLSMHLEPGDILAMLPATLLSGHEQGGLNQDEFLHAIKDRYDEPLAELAAELAQSLPLAASRQVMADQSLLLIRRKL